MEVPPEVLDPVLDPVLEPVLELGAPLLVDPYFAAGCADRRSLGPSAALPNGREAVPRWILFSSRGPITAVLAKRIAAVSLFPVSCVAGSSLACRVFFLFLRRASVSQAVQHCISKAVQHFYRAAALP